MQVNDKLTIRFSRALNTGDSSDRTIVEGQQLYLLYAFSGTRPVSSTDFVQHTRSGGTLVTLLPKQASTPAPTGAEPTDPPPTATAAPTEAAPGTGKFTASGGTYEAAWAVDDAATHVALALTTRAGGWVAVGFNTIPVMAGADMYIGWVDGDGTPHVADAYATGHLQPRPDSELGGTDNVDEVAIATTVRNKLSRRRGSTAGPLHSWNCPRAQVRSLLVLAQGDDGSVTIAFRRPIAKSDAFDIALSDGLYMLWAYGGSGSVHSTGGGGRRRATPPVMLDQHVDMGAVEVNVISGGLVQPGAGPVLSPGVILVILVGAAVATAALVRALAALCAPPAAADTKSNAFELSPSPSGATFNQSRGGSSAGLLGSSDGADAAPPSAARRALVRLLGRRLPLTDMPVYEALLLLLYAGMVVAAFFLGTAPTPARKIGMPRLRQRWGRSVARALTSPSAAGGGGRRATGSLAAANAFLLAVPATRNSVLLPLLGVAYDVTIVYHQWLGWAMAALTSAHFAVTWAQWPAGDPAATLLTTPQYLYGFAAWIIVLVTVAVALPWVRRRHFNVFQRLHCAFLAVFTLLSLHATAYVSAHAARRAAGTHPDARPCCDGCSGHMISAGFSRTRSPRQCCTASTGACASSKT